MGQETNQTISSKNIVFPNNHQAQLISLSSQISPAEIINQLNIKPPQAVIMLAGGAGRMEKKFILRLAQLFSRGIARTALENNALIIDGGTQSGIMELMGNSIADQGYKTSLLGISPAGLVTYPDQTEKSAEQDTPLDPNHSHFALVDSQEWGGETETMYKIADTLAKAGTSEQQIPALTVLVNGGGITKQEILQTVRLGWPVVVIKNSGRLADEIADLWQKKPDFIPDAVTAEIIADGDLHIFPLESSVAAMQRLIKRLINDHIKGNTPLEIAWGRFARYDINAGRQQSNFRKLQSAILVLGVAGTLLAITQATLRSMGLMAGMAWLDWVLKFIIILVPITITLFISAANKINSGNKWVLLRGSAEAIKQQIFRYRARAEIFSRKETVRLSPEIKLARKVEAISHNLMQTEVNLSALQPYTGPTPPDYILAQGDDGLSVLSPEDYLTFRLEDQLNFYQGRSVKLEKQLRRYQWLIWIIGGAGTLLAAIGLELWIALTTALVTAFATYLEYQQIERTLITYNQSATDLSNVQAWWLALSAEEQADQKNIDKLVKLTEQVIKKEHAGWVQDMQDTLAELKAKQTQEDDDDEQDALPTDEELE